MAIGRWLARVRGDHHGGVRARVQAGTPLYELAVRDASVPAAIVLALHYAIVTGSHWLTLPEPHRTPVAMLAAATALLFAGLGARWLRHPTTPDRLGTWLVAVVTLNNVHIVWRLGVPEHAPGFFMAQAGIGFVGLSFRRFWQLTALLWLAFALGPLRAGFNAAWGHIALMMSASFVLSFMMQLTNFRYRARLEETTRESERQREAAERSLARMREEIAHRERLQERLARAERLQSLGMLAGGVAHDFNNLLAVIIGNAGLALDRAPDPPMRADLEAILDAGERASLLAKELLAYAGRGTSEAVPLDLAREVNGVCALAQSSLPPRVSLRSARVSAGPIVRADRGQLQHVVLNLIMNAADATASGGGIEVATGVESLDADFASQLEPLIARSAGDYCFVRVADTGSGMSSETLQRMFEPFYTTKHTGRGLGLAAALGIARAHGGGFRVASALGVGSEFTLYLPRCRDAVADEPRLRPARAPQRDARVLVVDDQPAVRTTLARALADAGFRSVEASGGAEADAILRADPNGFAAAIVDMSMPELDGEETLQRLRVTQPALPVLLSSGFDAHEAAARLVKLPGVGFLAKPYRVESLRQRLTELIESQPHA